MEKKIEENKENCEVDGCEVVMDKLNVYHEDSDEVVSEAELEEDIDLTHPDPNTLDRG